MISRRVFAGCGLCAALGLVAETVSAQGSNPGFTRKVLQKAPVEGTGYDTLQMEITVEPKATIARHTHPGIESGVIVSGQGTFKMQGQPDRRLKQGESFFVATGTPHGFENGAEKLVIVSTYVVERDKPLASPA